MSVSYPFTLSESIDLTFTLFITFAVVWQSFVAHRQSRISAKQAEISNSQLELTKDSESRKREMEKPNVKITWSTYTHGRSGADGSLQKTSFDGFIITNMSRLDVTIVERGFERAIKKGDKPKLVHVSFAPAEEFDGTILSDMDVPRRLQYGETMKVLYPRSSRMGPARVRARCRDSLRNKYYADHWVEYTNELVSLYGEPGDGYVSLEEAAADTG